MRNYNLKEKISHGNAMFPLCVYRNASGYGKNILDTHWHDEVEIIYIEKGNAVFQLDTQQKEVGPGQALFINSGELHTAYSPDLNPCVFYAVVFDLHMLGSSSNDICQVKYIDPLISKNIGLSSHISGKLQWEKDIISKIKQLIKCYNLSKPGYEMSVKAALYSVLSGLAANNAFIQLSGTGSSVEQYKLERIKRVLKYIEDNYCKRMDISELSDVAYMSRYHFCRFFKAMTGQTPVEYINRYRINLAIRLFEDRNLKIMDAAMEVGFDNFSYFIKTFKEYKKCTPSEFRKRMKV